MVVEVVQVEAAAIFVLQVLHLYYRERTHTAVADLQNLLIEDGTDINEIFWKTLLNISSTT